MAGAMPAGALQFMAYESSKAQVLSLLALLVQTYKFWHVNWQLNTLLANYTLGGAKPHLVEVCAGNV
jgi:hypothetical protein